MPETLIYDGTKLTDLGKVVFSGEGGAEVSILDAFKSVPWLYRAMLMRADAVAGMPWTVLDKAGKDVSEAEEYKRLTGGLNKLLWLTEASLITAGAAYWILNANRSRKNLTPRWVVTDTITPVTTTARGLVGFTRTIESRNIDIPLDRMVYWWKPNLESEVAPGEPEATVALRAASILLNTDRMVESYFKRGAIKVTLLTVDGNPPKEEMDRLEHWWKRMITGIRKAYESIAIRASIHPVVIGSDLKDTDAGRLSEQKREDVAVALGVPQSLLFQSSAYSTGRHEDQIIFVERTVVPECNLITETLNEQLFKREGLTFAFHPEKLSIMQDALLERARAVSELVGAPVLSREEGRQILGLKGAEDEESAETEDVEAASNTEEEMRTWMRFALKRYREGRPEKAREFKCNYISQARAEAILGALEAAESDEEARAAFMWAGYP